MKGVYSRNANTQVMNFLRARPGEKFSAAQIERETGVPNDVVRTILNTKFHDGRYGVRREDRHAHGGPAFCVYSIGPDEPVAGDGPEREVTRWMRRHPRAARPSVIAQQTGVPVKQVARMLGRWCEDGTAVRCALPLHKGVDAYEYRLALVPLGVTRARPWVAGISP